MRDAGAKMKRWQAVETAAGGSVEAHLPRSRRQLSLDFPLSRHHSLDNPLQVVFMIRACSVSLDLSLQEI